MQVVSVNGPIVKVNESETVFMYEMVKVGQKKLIGEVISIDPGSATIQVYEDTSGMKPGEQCYPTGMPLCAELGPGLLQNMFDGILRPLMGLHKATGCFIGKGIDATSLDREKLWNVKILVKPDQKEVQPGEAVAVIDETELIKHYVLVPPGVKGKIIERAPDGLYKIEQTILKIQDEGETHEVKLYQRSPVRKPRPVSKRFSPNEPLVTGQRVIDAFFPIAKGGAAAIPGGFGTGKTMTQHQLAKWCEADLIVYIGCGERGNEMTEVLEDFPKLIDPKTNKPLMARTILIANTSNMPVAAREASIYTGITVAEYYRDMGYNVALMADSSSRWAEALRELSGRLEQMPAEEGYPAYLGTKLGEFYERAGSVQTLNGKKGSITVIAAVSPPGGDFSEPVTQQTKRFIRCFWGLDKNLASARHYPAINWLESYSEYFQELGKWFNKNAGSNWNQAVTRTMSVLQEEEELQQIVKLVGEDVLADHQKLVLKVARLVKVGFLQQAAFDPIDTYCDLKKQYKILTYYMEYYDLAKELLSKGAHISNLDEMKVNDGIFKLKLSIKNGEEAKFDQLTEEMKQEFAALSAKF